MHAGGGKSQDCTSALGGGASRTGASADPVIFNYKSDRAPLTTRPRLAQQAIAAHKVFREGGI